jgi:drug/metabolite transporter (DMT)-like permease
VTRRYVPLLLLLAALWGASYLFIKLAVHDLAPATLVAFRLALSWPLLFALLAARSGVRPALRELRGAWRACVVLGVLNAAVPFWLIAWGEEHVDSGVAAIANASVPIFVVLLALRFRPSERVTGGRLLGIVVGFAGVGVLAGVKPSGGWLAVAGTLAVVVASLSYACAQLYAARAVSGTSGLALATGSMFVAMLVLAPLAVAQLPSHAPGWKAYLGVGGLAVLGTVIAQIVFYRLVRDYGPSRTSLVTYLLPATALLYGALILGEPLRPTELAGMALILAGVALGSGVVRLARRAPAPASP